MMARWKRSLSPASEWWSSASSCRCRSAPSCSPKAVPRSSRSRLLLAIPTRLLRQIAPLETRTFISRNRGKRSLPLALRSAGAKPVIERLLGWADVALMNFRPGLAEQIGLDEKTLCNRYPRLVSGTVTAFGRRGPEASLAGMDTVVQARTGLMAANGRIVDGRPAPGDPVSADYMCAMSLAFGISAALLRRERTGIGGSVDVSLMQAAMALANSQLMRSENEDAPLHAELLARLAEQRRDGVGFVEQAEPQGMASLRALPMAKVYLRTYDTADAPIAVACGSPSLRLKFLDALGLEDAALDANDAQREGAYYDDLKQQAEAVMRSRSAAQWTARAERLGRSGSASALSGRDVRRRAGTRQRHVPSSAPPHSGRLHSAGAAGRHRWRRLPPRASLCCPSVHRAGRFSANSASRTRKWTRS